MRYFSVITALLYCSAASSQAKTPDVVHLIDGAIGCTEKKIIEEKIIACESIEIDAQVKDQKHWQNYLTKNLTLSSLAQDTIPGGIYTIRAIFIIDKDGSITNVRVQNNPGYGLGERVIKVISRYKEKWYPAIRNGRYVKAYKRHDLTLVVENKKCKQDESIEFIL